MGNIDIVLLVKLLLIGLVQGFTEPIPVSSSGHVMIASEILGLGEQGFTFAILTNTASLLAILYVYRTDISRITVNSIRYLKNRDAEFKSDFRFVCYIVIGSIPAGILGVLLSDLIAENVSMNVIAVMLLVTGIALWLVRNRQGWKTEGTMTAKDAFLIGLGQAAALTPGISRSGATVISSLAAGLNKETALRFSFLLYIPVSLGGVVLGISDFWNEPDKGELMVPYSAAFMGSLFMTYFALKWFMGIMEKGKLIYFTYYCFAVALLLFTFF